ncbi:MAG: hypothetical protein R6X29_11120 [Acidimicrobiia bacterium]
MSESPFLPEQDSTDPDQGTPFSFKLVLVLTAVYLLYRLIQGVVWLVERIGA